MALEAAAVQTGGFVECFERAERALAASGAPWVHALRREAIGRFASRGLPSTREDAWRHTNVACLSRTSFVPALEDTPPSVDAAEVETAALGSFPAATLVFVNGRLAPQLSAPEGTPGCDRPWPAGPDGLKDPVGRRAAGRRAAGPGLPHGVTIKGLARALAEDRARVEPLLALPADVASHAFASLSAAFLADGAYVHIARGVTLDLPIHLVYVARSPRPTMTAPRTLVVLEEGSDATVVETYVAIGSDVYFTNPLVQVVLGPGARLEHVKLEKESLEAVHLATIHARVGADASYVSHSIALGGALTRNDIVTILDAPGASCILNGLAFGSGRQHVDNHTRIDHARPHTTSSELYKGILDGRARGVFEGTIVVRPNAQKVNAHQTNKNLLLSDTAEADARPQLEIHADDVRCTHGAAVGRLDPDALFYLRSRGIGLAHARGLLTYAFATDVLAGIKIAPVRAKLESTIVARLMKTGLGSRGERP